MGYRVGMDLGSTAIKIAVAKDGRLAWCRQTPTAPGQDKLAGELMEAALFELGLGRSDIEAVAATGYGKGLASGAGAKVNEISANAKGMFALSEGRCRTIVNIGGQDLKVITLSEDGRVADFRMNDKCAAGTGRFFEQTARILDTALSSFGELSRAAAEPADLNSTCVVFAETEMVSLLAKGTAKESVIKGLHRSVARRVGHLLGRDRLVPEVYLDGGPAVNAGLREALEDELMAPVGVLEKPQFTVAFGAAIWE